MIYDRVAAPSGAPPNRLKQVPYERPSPGSRLHLLPIVQKIAGLGENPKNSRRIRKKVADLLAGARYENGIPVPDDPPEK